jgi:site-specific recombinase XerD
MWSEYDLQSICPITKVRVGSPVNNPQPAMDMETFKLLLAACRGDTEERDRAILFFLLDTGIRRMELCRLTIADLKNTGVVQVDSDGSKTGEPRKLFLVKVTQKSLLKYLKSRQNLAPEDPLFATITGDPLSAWGVCSLMARLAKRAGVPSQGMHKFRRGFALESLRSGADLVSISRMLGHKKVETTKRYLPQTDDDLFLVHQHTSPINQLLR